MRESMFPVMVNCPFANNWGSNPGTITAGLQSEITEFGIWNSFYEVFNEFFYFTEPDREKFVKILNFDVRRACIYPLHLSAVV